MVFPFNKISKLFYFLFNQRLSTHKGVLLTIISPQTTIISTNNYKLKLKIQAAYSHPMRIQEHIIILHTLHSMIPIQAV